MSYQKILILICGMHIALQAPAGTYYVSVDGSDFNTGTYSQPFGTIQKAVDLVGAGDTIFVRGGVYMQTGTIEIVNNGSEDNPATLMSFPGERAILDCSGQEQGGSNGGILITADYWHIVGIDIRGAGDNGLKIDGGNYNIIENCSFYRNRDSGLQMGNGASYNKVINCDSYYNADPPDYGDADGFAAKLDVGVENYYRGCRAWLNCDDGWDGYLRGADNVSTILDNCWAFENGYLENGNDPGSQANGNGFKMGGSDDKTLRHDYTLRNCLAFKNKSKGFDQNSNMGSMILYNCTGHNNGGGNYVIYKDLAEGEVLIIKNCLVLGNAGNIAGFAEEEANSWNGTFNVTEDDFISVDDAGAYAPRKADGSLPDMTYMHLAETSDLIDAGVDVGLPYIGFAPDLGCFEFDGPVAISGRSSRPGSISIYPNPASESAYLDLSNEDPGSATISLIDMNGRTVRTFMPYNPANSNGTITLDFTGISKGLYVVKVSKEERVETVLIMIN